MFEFLSPRHVAAKKLARMIAQKQLARPAPGETKAAHVESASAAPQLDSLELLLDNELKRYGISLV